MDIIAVEVDVGWQQASTDRTGHHIALLALPAGATGDELNESNRGRCAPPSPSSSIA